CCFHFYSIFKFLFPWTACCPARSRVVTPAHRPAVLIQFRLSGLPSSVQSTVPSFRLSGRQDRWLACRPARWNVHRIAFMLSDVPACRMECRHAFRLSCNPALRLAYPPSGPDACKQACMTDGTKNLVIPMHSFNV